MLLIRSVAFNVLFYLNLLVQIVAALPTLVMPRWGILAVAKFWARTNLWLLHAICGIKVEFRGLGKIPSEPLLVAAKHQSLWETFALLLILPDPAYIMPRAGRASSHHRKYHQFTVLHRRHLDFPTRGRRQDLDHRPVGIGRAPSAETL